MCLPFLDNKPDILHPSLPSFLGLSLSKRSSESFIGILDLFGFETSEVGLHITQIIFSVKNLIYYSTWDPLRTCHYSTLC